MTVDFAAASETELVAALEELFQNSDYNELTRALDSLMEEQLSVEKIAVARDYLEREYLARKREFLARYLFVLCARMDDQDFARYYLDQCIEEIKGKQAYLPWIERYAPARIELPEFEYHQHDVRREYEFEGEKRSYQVRSFSKTIGRNMTLLKTEYGSILFDCGAQTSQLGRALTITESELVDFLQQAGVTIDDIVAVIVSHAHRDHYGSLSALVLAGVPAFRIFVGEDTKRLISAVAPNMSAMQSASGLNNFFVPDNKIQIEAFANGHILGSEGYLVSFDNINVLYTGDFCLHPQRSVAGLDLKALNSNAKVREYGIDCVITESTFGQRRSYLDYASSERVLQGFIHRVLKLGYKVFLPAVAIGRCQELALMLNAEHSVLIDGMAVKISQEYEEMLGSVIFNANTRFSTESEEKHYNFNSNEIIIASSGIFSEGSTSAQYLEELLQRDENVAIIATGYMDSSEDAYGYQLLREWQNKNNLLLNVSLSTHASYDEICSLLQALAPRVVVAVHGNGIMNVRQSASAEKGDGTLELVLPEGSPIRKKMWEVHKSGHGASSERGFLTVGKSLVVSARKAGYVQFADWLEQLQKDREEFLAYVDRCIEQDYCCQYEEIQPQIVEESKMNVEIDFTALANEVVSKLKVKRKKGPLSDVMIVKMNEDDYCVAEKIAGGAVYYRFLMERERDAHGHHRHLTYELAKLKALELREEVRRTNPNCRIVEYDIKDFSATDPVQVDYVDCLKYRALIEEKIDACKGEEGLFFLGKWCGYSAGMDWPKAAISDKIEAIEELMQSDRATEEAIHAVEGVEFELYRDDHEMWRGYIAALNECMELQDECKPAPRSWQVYVIDQSEIGAPLLALDGYEQTLEELGNYTIHVVSDEELLKAQSSDCDMVLIFGPPKDQRMGDADWALIEWSQYSAYVFPTKRCNVKNLQKAIEQKIVRFFKLSGKAQDSDTAQTSEQAANAQNEGKQGGKAQVIASFPSIPAPPQGVAHIADIPDRFVLIAEENVAKLYSDKPNEIREKDIGKIKRLYRRLLRNPDGVSEKILFRLLGEPDTETLKSFELDCEMICKAITGKRCDLAQILAFREKYQKMFLCMLYNAGIIPAKEQEDGTDEVCDPLEEAPKASDKPSDPRP